MQLLKPVFLFCRWPVNVHKELCRPHWFSWHSCCIYKAHTVSFCHHVYRSWACPVCCFRPGVFTACIDNYKIHTVKPRRRKELPIFCTLLTFILLEKYNFSNKRERAFYYKIQLVNYRWRRQFLYLKIIGVGMFYTFSCEAYSTSGFHRSFFSL